jgi:hypothetical protein
VTPLYPLTVGTTLLTGGGRSVGTVRSRTEAMEFFMEHSVQLHECASRFSSAVYEKSEICKIMGFVFGMFVLHYC